MMWNADTQGGSAFLSSREAEARRHAGLVMSLARRFAGRAEIADLYQAGCVGLLRAIDRYDQSRGTTFSTFAVPIILSEIVAYLRGSGPIHVPRPVRELAQKCRHAQDSFRAELSREPQATEIAARLGIDAADVVYAMESEAHVYSLFDQVSFDHESLELHEVLPGDLGVETSVCESIALSDALSALSEIERRVVAMRFFEERTQAETASLLGISQPQVHRIEKAALLALRRSMEGE